jgi:hypothetical protein
MCDDRGVTDEVRSKAAQTLESRRRQVDWKLLFNQLFALEIKKEHVLGSKETDSDERLDDLLRAYTYYTPVSFNDALDELSSMQSSDEAFEARRPSMRTRRTVG